MATTERLPFDDKTAAQMVSCVARLGLTLCHINWKRGARRGVLTLTIDKENGVTLDDCEKTTHAVETLLDGLDVPGFTEVPYSLEVSSPGLDRPMFTVADCERFQGRRVTAQLTVKVDGASRLKGILEKVDGDLVTILDEDQHRRYTVRFGDAKIIRLVPEL